MKNRIIVTNESKGKLQFYLMHDKKRYYLFTQAYSQGVYDFFKRGRAEGEIRQYNRWKRNRRLDKTIEKIPLYTSYVLRQVV